MAIIINNDVANSPHHIYDEVLQRLIKKGGDSQVKNLIRKHLVKVFTKDFSDKPMEERLLQALSYDNGIKGSEFMDSVRSSLLMTDLMSNLSISRFLTEQGVEGFISKDNKLPDIEQRTFGWAVNPWKENSKVERNVATFVKDISLDDSYREFNDLISTPFNIYYDSESREFTLDAVPMKSILVATLEIDMNSKKLSGVAKAVYSYILEQSENNLEDIVDGLYRSLTTKFKNRYKKFVHPDTVVSVDDVLQGTSLPSEMDYDVVVKNPTHLFTEYYSEEEFIDEMGKLYDDNPNALNRMIVEVSRPIRHYDKIHNYIESKERAKEWILAIFGLTNFEYFLENYNHLIMGEKLKILSYLNDNEKLSIVNRILPEVPGQGDEFKAHRLTGSIFSLLEDIFTQNPGLLDSIENPENIYSRYFVPGFSYIHPGYVYGNDLGEFLKFTNTKTGFFVINDSELMYEYIKSFVTLVGVNYGEFSKKFGLSIAYDDLVDLFNNRVIKIEERTVLEREFGNDFTQGQYIVRLEE